MKRLLLLIFAIPLVLIVLLLVLVFTLDPNQLKPVLEDQARQQNIELNLAGDIGWTFIPQIGLSIQSVSVKKEDPGTSVDAQIGTAQFAVQLWPLLQRQIKVDGVLLQDVKLKLRTKNTGDTPTEDTPEPKSSDPSSSDAPELAVKRIELRNINIQQINADSGAVTEVQLEKFVSNNLALDGTPFPVEILVKLQAPNQPPLSVELNSDLSMNLDAQNLELKNAKLNLKAADAKTTLHLNNQTHWGEPLSVKGDIKLEPTAAKPFIKAFGAALPEMQNPDALSNVSLSSRYSLENNNLNVPNLRLTLDQTTIDGNISIENLSAPKITARIKGDTLNLDDYLPPPSDKPKEEPAAAPVQETPLPLAALRDIDADVQVAFESIRAKGIDMINPGVKVNAKNGLIKTTTQAQLADGSINSNTTFDARPPKAILKFDLKSQGVEIGKLLSALADTDALSGNATLDVTGSSLGATDQQLIKNLNVNAKAASEQMRLTPINLEQQFCKALALLQQKQLPEFEWPQLTQFEPMVVEMTLADQVMKLNTFDATIAKILGKAQGSMNLKTGKFDFPFSLSLGTFAGEIEGCLPIEEKWCKYAIPIRCKGNLDSIGAKTCLPDTQAIGDILKDKAKKQIDKEVEKKKDKLEDKAAEELKKKLGDEKSKEVQDLLKKLR